MIVVAWIACALPPPQDPPSEAAAPEVAAPEAVAPEAADPIAEMRTRPIAYTHHGRCRMGCRHFDEAEVAQILAEGVLDPSRSREDGACPSHALEGTTRDGQHARMVFAACDDETRLITAVDLREEWPCDCD